MWRLCNPPGYHSFYYFSILSKVAIFQFVCQYLNWERDHRLWSISNHCKPYNANTVNPPSSYNIHFHNIHDFQEMILFHPKQASYLKSYHNAVSIVSGTIYLFNQKCILPFIWKKLSVCIALRTEWSSRLSSKSGDTLGSSSISLLKHFSTVATLLTKGLET